MLEPEAISLFMNFYDSCYPYMFAFFGFETVVAWSNDPSIF